MSFLRTNIPEKLLAVVLSALLIWSVNRSQVPEQSATFTKRLTYEGVPPGMKVVGDAPQVLVTASGERAALDAVVGAGQNAVSVAVHLSSARVGTQSYNVYPSIRPDLLEGVKWKVSPERVEVTLGSESDRTLPVKAVPSVTAKGFKPESWTADPSSVLVSGEERLIARVASAEIRYDPTNAASFDGPQPIVLVDRNDRAITRGQFTLSPSMGRVVPSAAASIVKHLPIVPQWRGVLPKGYRISGYRVVPGQIAVRGAGAVLERLAYVTTAPVLLTALTSDQTATVEIAVPEGVQVPRRVSVQVQISIDRSEEPE
jgi:YbbR domain-containing protein